jgi:hypothetical protein
MKQKLQAKGKSKKAKLFLLLPFCFCLFSALRRQIKRYFLFLKKALFI